MPMLAVFETIDLGLVSEVRHIAPPALELLEVNHPVLRPDPVYEDVVYVYHAFGVHALRLTSVVQALIATLRAHEDDPHPGGMLNALAKAGSIGVQPVLSTFSVQNKCSNPVIGVTLPNDIYLNYSILALTSSMRLASFALTLRPTALQGRLLSGSETPSVPHGVGIPLNKLSIGEEAYTPPLTVVDPLGLPSNARRLPPQGPSLMLTPETMRYLAEVVTQLKTRIGHLRNAYEEADTRSDRHKEVFAQQQKRAQNLLDRLKHLQSNRLSTSLGKLRQLQEQQKALQQHADQVLRLVKQNASPGLSEHETRWFRELKQMEAELNGGLTYDTNSLLSRASVVRFPARAHTPCFHSSISSAQA